MNISLGKLVTQIFVRIKKLKKLLNLIIQINKAIPITGLGGL
jgi:hypothetical protein